MFILGLNAFGGNKFFDTNIACTQCEYLSLENASYNAIRVDAETKSIFSKPIMEWGEFTTILGNFNGSLECGNLQQNGQGIQSLRFKKRPKGSLDWLFIEELPYDKNQNIYTVHDRLAYAQEEYEYGLTPVTNGVEGGMVTDSCVCEFDGLWVVDRYNSAKLMYNLDYGDINYHRNISVFETLERRYPMTQSSSVRYKSGSNNAVIISQETENQSGKLDYRADRKEVDRIADFLDNAKAKIIKDGSGRQYLVMCHDISETPSSSHSGGLSTISFNWTEIGDTLNLEDLIDYDLLPDKLIGEGGS